MSTISDTLNKAADLIETAGWWDGNSTYRGTAHCAATAIVEIADRDDLYDADTSTILFLERHLGIWDIAKWNDAQLEGPTVVAALREAAQHA